MLYHCLTSSAGAPLAFIDGIGGMEMLLIFVVVLMLFGGDKLPEFARGLGKTMREFKKAASGVEEEFRRAMDEDERKRNAAATPATPALTGPEGAPSTYPDDGSTEYGSDGNPVATSTPADASGATTPAAPNPANGETSPASSPESSASPTPPTPETKTPSAPPKPAPVVNEDYP